MNYEEYSRDGSVILNQKGNYTGELKDYYDNGNLKTRALYKNGLMTDVVAYEEDGSVVEFETEEE